MLRKLAEVDRGRILEYVMAEPEVNLFFIGDIENYGIESEEVSVYAEELETSVPGVGKLWDSLILRYFDNYIVYSQKEAFNVNPVVDFLKGRIVDSMNGKDSIMRKIAPYFPKMRLDSHYILKCDRVADHRSGIKGAVLRTLTADDAEEIVDLYLSIKEVAPRFERRDKKIAERKNNLQKDGFAMGMFVEDELVSVAEISADSAISGMIIGTATHPDHRGKGYASMTTTALCEEAFRRGKEFLCVFYDDPGMGAIYKKTGFVEIGRYALMY